MYNKNLQTNNEASLKEIEKGWDLYRKNLEINEKATAKELEKGWAAYYKNLEINNKASSDEMAKAWDEYQKSVEANNEAIRKEAEKNADLVTGSFYRMSENGSNAFSEMFDAFKTGVSDTFRNSQMLEDDWNQHMEDMKYFASDSWNLIKQDFGDAIGDMIVKGKEFDMQETFDNIASGAISLAVQMTIQAGIIAAAGWTAKLAWWEVALVIAAIAAAIAIGKKVWEKYGDDIKEIGKKVKDIWEKVYGVLYVLFSPVILLHEALVKVFNFLRDNFFFIVQGTASILGGLFGGVLKFFEGIGDALKPLFNLIDKLAGKLKKLWDWVKKIVESIGGAIKDVGDFVGDKARNIGRNIDPTNKEGGLRKGIAELDITNKDSGIRELGRKLDPTSWFATGGEFLTTGPRLFVAGERGPEHVSIKPAGTGDRKQGGSTYIFNGPVIMDENTAKMFTRDQMKRIEREASLYA